MIAVLVGALLARAVCVSRGSTRPGYRIEAPPHRHNINSTPILSTSNSFKSPNCMEKGHKNQKCADPTESYDIPVSSYSRTDVELPGEDIFL